MAAHAWRSGCGRGCASSGRACPIATSPGLPVAARETKELQELGHKAGQSRSLTEHIIEDHAEFWCLCLAIPQVYISDSVDEWYDEDTHESE